MQITKGKSVPSSLVILLLVAVLTSCNLPTQIQQTESPVFTPVSGLQQTMLTFRVRLPESIPAGDSVYLNLLDEVTGLGLNPHRYIMQAEDALHYSITLPFYLGKVLKYRYSREGVSVVDEHRNNDQAVRYRMYHVEGPGTVDDVLSQWTDTNYQAPAGRILGVVTDNSTGQPVPNILVTAGGEQAFTLADGSFLLESLPPGTHNMVFYSLDGTFTIYQQGAVVAVDSTTPVSVALEPARLVTVIFTVKVPSNTPLGTPLRLAGNLSQLGNTFADLSGGVSALASRMPFLGILSDGRYMVTLSLPAGAYIEYKYTLGD
ncbi:MAG TPA: carboxypeptidase regulatory-like domain-containing protein, partial [Anaerolineales bacterium]|nr:carboxypeptidase regulatory-like domain-containing protein [Anaerolineales bacterium]